mmetsp:Transcript_28560/g.42211  ORF Transcript_28560/g.42211 Transcript_28560/m.42211 type:complete len:267 (+) Transcript_28560:143-943(+)
MKSIPLTYLIYFLFFILNNEVNKSFCVEAFSIRLHRNELFRKTNRGPPYSFANEQVQEVKKLQSIALFGGLNDGKVMMNLYQRYVNWLDHSPLVARSVTAALVGCVGDMLAQWLEARTSGLTFVINWTRFNAFFVSGLFYVGPFLQYWYGWLWAIGRWMGRNVTESKLWQTLAQVFVDQTLGVLVFFPIYFYAYEFSEAIVSLRAPMWASATKKLNAELMNVFVTQYKVWPIANMISFGLIPERFRVLFSNIFSVFWNAYLCTRVS